MIANYGYKITVGFLNDHTGYDPCGNDGFYVVERTDGLESEEQALSAMEERVLSLKIELPFFVRDKKIFLIESLGN
jgi:hypothetical protein